MTTTSKTGNHTNHSIGQRLHAASDRFAAIKDDVANNLGKRVNSLGALMKEHPLAAIGIGLGVGYLIVRLIHR